MIITFCGHSKYSEGATDESKLLKLFDELSNGGEGITFYLGGYGDFDAFCKKCAKQYKALHPNAKLLFITPYLDKWLDDRREYLQREYDGIIYPEIENVPLRYAISKRNEWMVREADHVIAYVRSHYGGAYQTLLYAHKHNKPYTNLYKGNYELY